MVWGSMQGVPFENRNVVAASRKLSDDFDLTTIDSLGTKGEVRHSNAVFYNITASVEAALAESAQIQTASRKVLLGMVPVRTQTPPIVFSDR